jgi:amino acid adenylation domain-containing protein/non-ribosomal peptide synthase protein (TIGR01720 family)
VSHVVIDKAKSLDAAGESKGMTEQRELLPLTHAQRRIWYIEELYPNTCVHNIGGLVHIRGLVDMSFLEQAIHAFLYKNVGVRLQLTMLNGEIRQFLSSEPLAPLRRRDFRFESDPEQALHDWIQQEFTTPFPLLEHPLYEFVLVRVSEETTGYLIKIHHMVADGWTIQLMTEQISTLYEQFASGQPLEMQPESGYVEYIREEQTYLQSERFLRDRSFWRETFAEFPETFLEQSSNELAATRQTFIIDAERTFSLRQLASRKKWSLNTLFVSALLLYFHTLQQRDDMIIGIPVFNRRGAKEKRLAGMFTSNMPFRMRLSSHDTLAAFQESVNQRLLKCFFHQKYPYNLLIQDLGITHERINQLFQVCVNYYNTRMPTALAGYPVENIEWFNGQQIYSLQVVIKDWLEQGTLQLMIDYKQHDYTKEQVERLFNWLLYFIDTTLEQNQIRLGEVELLTVEEKRAIVYARNQTSADYPREQPVQCFFEAQVNRTPSATALLCEGQRVTYQELNARSNQLARALRVLGVGRNGVVGIMARHSVALVVGIWGIMKAGGAYLPIDPAYPVERINHMLSDSQAFLLLTDQDMEHDLQFMGQVLDLSRQELYQGDASNLPIINRAEDLAYLIYTSGSTGKPKGIMIEHRSLSNYIWWAKKTYVCDQHDCFALYSSIAFDLTVTSIFTPLIGGNSIAIYGDSQHEFVLKRILRENLCSIVKATPAHLALLDDTPLEGPRLRCLIVGGEDFRTKTARHIWQKFGGAVRIFNEYGPTETTVGCMIYEYLFERDTGVSVPIGKPIDNTQIYLLTEQLQPVPDGVVAEIYVAGDGVARGYTNRDALTAEKFLKNPFLPEGRMYKTGDLARYHQGTIEYLGRADHQVKLQGYRVELTEIESELLRHEAVEQAAVCCKHSPHGHKYLVAFVQLQMPLSSIEIKRFLARRLPSFMIPTAVIELQGFPLSPNGKIDRDALADLDVDAFKHESLRAHPAIEQQLIACIREVMQVEDVTPESNFYFLGGDSIKAIQLVSRLKALDYQVKPADIFTYPLLRELALVLETQVQKPVHQQEPCEGFIKETPIIAWFLAQHFANPDFWHQSVLLEMRKQVPAELLNQALRRLVHHHDTLRLNYDEQTRAFFYNHAHLADDLQVLESAYLSDSKPETFQRLCFSLKARLRLSHGLLFRAFLLHADEKPDRLLLVAHHAIIDGVSWRILLEDLQTLLQQGGCEESGTLPAKTTSLQCWAEAVQDYARSIDSHELTFWNQVGSERTHFPGDFAANGGETGQRNTYTVELSAPATRRLLTEANQAYNTRAQDLLLTALVLTLTDLLHTREIVLEVEAHGRNEIADRLDLSRTVGWFTALYPLRLTVEGQDLANTILTIREQLQQVPEKGIGFGVLAYCASMLPRPGRPGILWNYLGEIDNGQAGEFFTLSEETTGPDSAPENHLTCEIEILALIREQQLRVAFTYSAARYKETTIRNIAESFLSQLQTLITKCCTTIPQVPSLETTACLTEEELHLLLED